MALAPPVLVPRNADDVVHNVVVRQLIDDQHDSPDDMPRSPVLDAMRKVADASRDGTPIGPLKGLIDQQTQGNEDLATVVGSMYLRHRMHQFVSYLEMQDDLERFLKRCMKRSDLTPAEALVFLKLLKDEVKAIAESVANVLKDGLPTINADNVTARMDYSVQVSERKAAQSFDDTTAVGREVVRKLLLRARKKLK